MKVPLLIILPVFVIFTTTNSKPLDDNDNPMVVQLKKECGKIIVDKVKPMAEQCPSWSLAVNSTSTKDVICALFYTAYLAYCKNSEADMNEQLVYKFDTICGKNGLIPKQVPLNHSLAQLLNNNSGVCPHLCNDFGGLSTGCKKIYEIVYYANKAFDAQNTPSKAQSNAGNAPTVNEPNSPQAPAKLISSISPHELANIPTNSQNQQAKQPQSNVTDVTGNNEHKAQKPPLGNQPVQTIINIIPHNNSQVDKTNNEQAKLEKKIENKNLETKQVKPAATITDHQTGNQQGVENNQDQPPHKILDQPPPENENNQDQPPHKILDQPPPENENNQEQPPHKILEQPPPENENKQDQHPVKNENNKDVNVNGNEPKKDEVDTNNIDIKDETEFEDEKEQSNPADDKKSEKKEDKIDGEEKPDNYGLPAKPSDVDQSEAISENMNLEGDSYFFTYFMIISMIFVVGYITYHNKQKILALALEGRRGRRHQYRSRRPNSSNYQKLDSNLEEAMSSSCSKNTSHVIY